LNEVAAADVLVSWAAGVAGCGALVAWWRIVGPGYLWLAAGTAALLGIPATFLDASPASIVATAAVVVAAASARRPSQATMALAAAAVGFAWAGTGSGVVGALTAAAFLGGVTSEMLLGHWYLVDPRLPRSALFRLDAVAVAGLVAEVGWHVVNGVLDWVPDDAILGWTFIVMAVATAALLGAVAVSLREPAYPAVMAATGLSYLAVLTALGTSVVGRILAEGTP